VPAPLLGQEAPQAKQLIRAAEGGQLTAPSGLATLAVPPGALAGDTTISLTELTAEEGAALGPAFELQPDALQFLKPATLTIRYKPGDLPEGYEPDDVCIATEARLSPQPVGAGAGGPPVGAGPPGGEGTEGMGLGFLEETAVDPDAGTASVELTHLSRYRLRRLPAHVLGTRSDVLRGGRKGDCWDYGLALPTATGAGKAECDCNLAPKVFGTSDLWVSVSCPIGHEGAGTAFVAVYKHFRVRPGRSGLIGSTSSVLVALHHSAQIAAGTNWGVVGLAVWCEDRFANPVGLAVDVGRGGQPAGAGLWAQDFIPPDQIAGGWWGAIPAYKPAYNPDSEYVLFKKCELEAPRIYTVGVSLMAAVTGGRANPPLGGSIEFPRALGFVVDYVRVDSRPG